MYDDDNLKHYDYFDYLDASGIVQQYEPDSDMDFVDFKSLMKKEWRETNDSATVEATAPSSSEPNIYKELLDKFKPNHNESDSNIQTNPTCCVMS